MHANQHLVFRVFFLFDCVVEGTSHCRFNFEPRSFNSVSTGRTCVHTRTKASLCLTLVDKQEGQAGASFLGC